jgi:hypothetical protein
VKHWGFEAAMFFFVLVNTVEMIWLMTDPEDPVANILNELDNIMLYIFTAEAVFRIVGTGLYVYWSDSWNKFDFALVVVSYATDALLDSLDFAKNARSARLVKISRLQKTLRITKSIRGFRIFKFCMGILSSFYRIKQLLEIIIISLPALWRTLSLILLFFYWWGCVGCEIYREAKLVRYDIPPYGISDFYSYGDAILELAHIMIANGWAEVMVNYAERFHNDTVTEIFFISFHAIVNIVLLSLLSGLVWEVFSFVDKTSNVTQREESKNQIDLEDLSKNLRKNHFHTLRYISIIQLIDEDEEKEEEENKAKLSLNMTGLQKEIKKEMGDEEKNKLDPQAQKFSRKSIHFTTHTELKDSTLHRKRASLTNTVTGSMSPLNMIKDKASQDFKGKQPSGLDKEIEKIDNSLRISRIPAYPIFTSRMTGLNLDYGIGEEKSNPDSSHLLVTPVKQDAQKSQDDSFSQGDLFVNSNRQIVTFSEDHSVKDLSPGLKQPLNPSSVLVQTLHRLEDKSQPVNLLGTPEKKSQKPKVFPNTAIDSKSLLPHKPISETEDSHSKEGFKFNNRRIGDTGKNSKPDSETSSDMNNRLVLKKRKTSIASKTELLNKKTPTKVGKTNRELD